LEGVGNWGGARGTLEANSQGRRRRTREVGGECSGQYVQRWCGAWGDPKVRCRQAVTFAHFKCCCRSNHYQCKSVRRFQLLGPMPVSQALSTPGPNASQSGAFNSWS